MYLCYYDIKLTSYLIMSIGNKYMIGPLYIFSKKDILHISNCVPKKMSTVYHTIPYSKTCITTHKAPSRRVTNQCVVGDFNLLIKSLSDKKILQDFF